MLENWDKFRPDELIIICYKNVNDNSLSGLPVEILTFNFISRCISPWAVCGAARGTRSTQAFKYLKQF